MSQSSVRSFHVLGSEWNLPSVYVPKHKPTPFLTEARKVAVADALKVADRERIKAEAQEAAVRVMAEWEARR